MLHPPNVVLPPLGSVPVSIDPHYNPPWAAASSLQAQMDALTMAEDVRRYQDMHRLAAQAHAGILDELNGLKRTLPELLQHAQMARPAAELGDHDRAAVERPSGVLGGGTLDYRSEEHTSELQSLMRISYAVFCLKQRKILNRSKTNQLHALY